MTEWHPRTDSTRRPRAVFVGKTRVPRPVPDDLRRKFQLLSQHLDPTLIVVGQMGLSRSADASLIIFPEIRPAPLGTVFFYTFGPLLAVLLAAGRRPSAVICQSPYEGYIAGLAARLVPHQWRPATVVEMHGDPSSATRLYGSRVRRILSPAADRVAATAVTRADRVRAIGPYTRSIVEEMGYEGPIDEHIAFSDFTVFLETDPTPLPDDGQALFVGALDRHKAPDTLIEAWSEVARQCPDAVLRIVGDGPLRAALKGQVESLDLGASVRFEGRVTRAKVASYMDQARFLVLPSRSEGLGLVVIEAMARARAVVATDVGGISELVHDRVTGILVRPDDVGELASAMIELLEDRALATRLGANGREHALERDPLDEFEAGTARLADWIMGRRRPRSQTDSLR